MPTPARNLPTLARDQPTCSAPPVGTAPPSSCSPTPQPHTRIVPAWRSCCPSAGGTAGPSCCRVWRLCHDASCTGHDGTSLGSAEKTANRRRPGHLSNSALQHTWRSVIQCGKLQQCNYNSIIQRKHHLPPLFKLEGLLVLRLDLDSQICNI